MSEKAISTVILYLLEAGLVVSLLVAIRLGSTQVKYWDLYLFVLPLGIADLVIGIPKVHEEGSITGFIYVWFTSSVVWYSGSAKSDRRRTDQPINHFHRITDSWLTRFKHKQ